MIFLKFIVLIQSFFIRGILLMTIANPLIYDQLSVNFDCGFCSSFVAVVFVG